MKKVNTNRTYIMKQKWPNLGEKVIALLPLVLIIPYLLEAIIQLRIPLSCFRFRQIEFQQFQPYLLFRETNNTFYFLSERFAYEN